MSSWSAFCFCLFWLAAKLALSRLSPVRFHTCLLIMCLKGENPKRLIPLCTVRYLSRGTGMKPVYLKNKKHKKRRKKKKTVASGLLFFFSLCVLLSFKCYFFFFFFFLTLTSSFPPPPSYSYLTMEQYVAGLEQTLQQVLFSNNSDQIKEVILLSISKNQYASPHSLLLSSHSSCP